MMAGGASHDPPMQATFGRARYPAAVAGVIPPVGQNRTWGKGPCSARSSPVPPAAAAGNSFA
jgi:hypothetical protein